MAKYQINYKCGHSGTVNLLGKIDDRERKIKWLSGINCPKCNTKENGLECRMVLLGDMVEIQFIGDTYPHKEEIKSLGGYRFSKDLVSGLFDTNAKIGWSKRFKVGDRAIKDEIEKIETSKLPVPKWKANILDVIATKEAVKIVKD